MNPLLHTKGKGFWRRGSSQEETQQPSFNGNMPPSKALPSTQGLMSSQDENQQSSDREGKPYSEAALSDTARISQGDIQSSNPGARPRQRKILIFGETGVGKSSIVNMLADKEITISSNNAIGCTFENKRYDIKVTPHSICVYDTTGLNESVHGKVPALRAIAGLFKIIRELADSDGIDFLIFVTRPRITENTARNYSLFYKTFCREKVPVVIVITGLEHEAEMDDWWTRNKKEFSNHGMEFHGHACVTAIKGKETPDGYSLQKEYDLSKKTLEKAILSLCQDLEPWKEDTEAWFQFTLAYLLSYLAAFVDASQATRQKMIKEALVRYAGLQKGEAKRIAARIASSLQKE